MVCVEVSSRWFRVYEYTPLYFHSELQAVPLCVSALGTQQVQIVNYYHLCKTQEHTVKCHALHLFAQIASQRVCALAVLWYVLNVVLHLSASV